MFVWPQVIRISLWQYQPNVFFFFNYKIQIQPKYILILILFQCCTSWKEYHIFSGRRPVTSNFERNTFWRHLHHKSKGENINIEEWSIDLKCSTKNQDFTIQIPSPSLSFHLFSLKILACCPRSPENIQKIV